MSAQQNNRNLNKSKGEGEMVAVQQSFSGPLPPPTALAQYDHVLPGAAERIIRMAESQHEHRQSLESSVIKGNIDAQKKGALYGFILAMTVVIIGGALIYLGRPVAGLVAIITAIGGLVTTFLLGKSSQKKELADKST